VSAFAGVCAAAFIVTAILCWVVQRVGVSCRGQLGSVGEWGSGNDRGARRSEGSLQAPLIRPHLLQPWM